MGQTAGDSLIGNNPAAPYLGEDGRAVTDTLREQGWAMRPAPSQLSERLMDVTTEGIKKIPDGFMHSLDPHYIIPNVAIGIGIGAATKLLLPAGGPVAKIAALGIGAYFLGKPLVESYGMAWNAKTMGEMDMASTHLGDTIGGLPVMMVEGGIGARIGVGLMGKALSTQTAAPFVNWKAGQYAKLDGRIDGASAGLATMAFEKFGIGGPVMRSVGARTGIIPPYVLEELARRTKNPDYLETIRRTEGLAIQAQQLKARGIARIDHQGAREVYDAQGKEQVGVRVRSEGEVKTGNPDVDNVYEQTGEVRTFYKEVHGRNSIDGEGMKLESTVNYGNNYENAFWDGFRMTYGRPGPDSPFRTFIQRGITGHEITHGVTEKVSGLIYNRQPGALNEHLSDVFGALIEQRVLGQTAAEASWLVGDGIWRENVKGRALRDMRNPGTAYDDPMLGKDPQPAHMKDYVNTRRDNGGVHINSGIPNRAFVLFAERVGGFAWEGPGKIWYEARANAGSSPSFAQFAYHTIEAAKKLGTPETVAKLEQSWADVGIKPSLTDTGITELPLLVGFTPDRGH